MKLDPTKNIPTVLVLFGATGDLIRKKIAPALFHLSNQKMLPKMFLTVGFARRKLTNHDFRGKIAQIIEKHAATLEDQINIKPLLNFFEYFEGNFENLEDYHGLEKKLSAIDGEWGVCSNKLFYLAVPPQFYESILRHLASSGLTKPCSQEEGWTRVIIEKPFGRDSLTGEKLDTLLGTLFREEQIYRIDHYLAKEMLQNILTFRFANNLFEKDWNNSLIERIDIRLLESLGAEDRGGFYDGVGALRDVGQNHLLQMLALVTMEHPLDFESAAVQKKRAEILSKLKIMSEDEIRSGTFRAQYDGYRDIPGVSPNSETETYFKIEAALNDPKWKNVPITMESGKRLGEPVKEVVVTMKHPVPCLCPRSAPEHHKNRVIFALEPTEGIKIEFWSKKPGLEFLTEPRTFDFLYLGDGKKTQYIEEYKKLLLDCISGDQTLFISTREVAAMWKFIDPITTAWEQNLVPLKYYQPDTRDITKEANEVFEAQDKVLAPAKKEIGLIGLGKMGKNLALHLSEKGWMVFVYDANPNLAREISGPNIIVITSLAEFKNKLQVPRIIWVMVPAFVKTSAGKPAGKPVDQILFGKGGLAKILKSSDIIIDGGNSYYKDSVKRALKLEKRGVNFLDAGVSGGPHGARHGAALMIGGKQEVFTKLEHLFDDLALQGGYAYLGESGAGHFVKMIHNGIEYGMMQAIAEGFTILKNSNYSLDLKRVSQVYSHGSVIESQLTRWLEEAFEIYGDDLPLISGTVHHTGEGAWTVKTARELGIKTKVIKDALQFRIESGKNPSYTGKILSALRERFGGHKVK